MASCITSKWASYSPQISLTVIESSNTGDSSTLSWTLEYIASSAASTSTAKAYEVKIAGTTVKTGTYNINGKTGTSTIASGSKTISKTTASKSVSFSCSMAINLVWSGVSKSTISASGSLTIPAKTSYSIKYNANGGTGAPANQTKWYDEDLTLSSTKPTRSGYTFSKWTTESNGTGAVYTAGQKYTTNTSLYLYAQYTANKYTIAFNANGGTGAPSAQTKTHGVAITLPTTVPTKNGYNFLGWATTSTSTTAIYPAGGSYTTEGSRTLYAVWEVGAVRPTITDVNIFRCNSSGTANEAGAYIKVEFSWTSSVSAPTITVKWKSENETTYASANTISSTGSGTSGSYSSVHGSGDISTTYTYSVVVTVSDGANTTTASRTVSTSRPTINALEGGRGIAFGKFATDEELFDVDFDAKFRHDINILGSLSAGQLLDAKGFLIRNGLTAYESAGIDPDTTLEHEIVTNAKTPNGAFMYILTYFYADKTAASNRMQISMPYNKADGPFYRYYLNGSWSTWFRFGGIYYGSPNQQDRWTGDVWNGSYPIMRRVVYADITSTGTNVALDTISNFGMLVNISGGYTKTNGTHIPPTYYYSSSNYVMTWVTTDGVVTARASNEMTGNVFVDYVNYNFKLTDLTSYI